VRLDIARRRLSNQHLSTAILESPALPTPSSNWPSAAEAYSKFFDAPVELRVRTK
jgi:hypothetical protein